MKKYLRVAIACLLYCFLLNFQDHVYAAEDGSSAQPYTVGSASELKEVLTKSTPGTLYIKLKNDITYTTENFKIGSDININGDGHAMLYAGNNYITNSRGYTLSGAGYHVNFNNIDFGNATFKYGQTFYGILSTNYNQVDLTVENVNYYGRNGAQPFCMYNGNSTVLIKGKNSFKSITGGSSGQEFMEGAQLIFDRNSSTNIEHSTDSSQALFWNSVGSSAPFDLQLKENAQVNINTNKKYISYGTGLNVQVANRAKLSIGSSNYGTTFTNNKQANLSLASEASLKVKGAGEVGSESSAPINLNVTDPNWVSFENTKGSKVFNTDVNVQQQTQSNYSLDSISGSDRKTRDAPKGNFGWKNNQIDPNKTNKAIYRPEIKALANVKSNVNTNPLVSELLFTELQANNPYAYQSMEYKVYEKPIVSDVTNQQSIIENDHAALYKGSVTTSQETLSKVKAGSYTIYFKVIGKLEDESITSDWIEKTITVNKSPLNVTVPLDMSFSVIDNNPFKSVDQYHIINHTNFETSFNISSVSGGTKDINLVNAISNNTPNRSLYLALKDTKSNELPFVASSPNNKISVSPFDGTSTFNVVGQYKGSIKYSEKEKLNYKLKLEIK